MAVVDQFEQDRRCGGRTDGDVACKPRPMPGLVGRAGPTLLAAELAVGFHHATRHAARRLLQSDARAANEVERADI